MLISLAKQINFLILSASIKFIGPSLPLYFSMRRYPVKKGMIDQKKMENAFLLELSRLLPHEKYKYTIVADCGFATIHFMEQCQKQGFNFVIRTPEKWNIEIDDCKGSMKELEKENKDWKVKLKSGKLETRLVTSFNEDGQGWYIFTDLEEASFNRLIEEYKGRFQCEKMFQDEKSSVFEIEKSKIEKYSRFKRLLFCMYITQGLMMFVGD